MKMKGSQQFTQHPLHLLDDLLASLPSPEKSTRATDQSQNSDGESSSNPTPTDAAIAMTEAKHDVVLKAADELFGNNMSLLENSLALLDEQEQYETIQCEESRGEDTSSTAPVIRKIRAKRSKREAILIRKQRKKSTSSAKKSKLADSQVSLQVTDTNNNKNEKNQHVMDDYYLCLLGKDQISRRALLTNKHGWSKIQRQGAHCTCRSFFQNIKGGSRSTSAKNSEASIPPCSNVVVCKHLLAAILMPHLLPWSRTSVVHEDVDDREFAKLVMRASIG